MNSLILPSALETQLTQHLLADPAQERVGVLFAGRHMTSRGWRLLARDWWPADPRDYMVQGAYHLEIEPGLWARAAKRARTTGESIVIAHSHPSDPDVPEFSPTDDAGERRLLPKLEARAPGPHAALVASPGGLKARLYDSDANPMPLAVGQRVTPSMPSPGVDARFDRQRMAIGAEGQALLSAMSVAIVGLGGLGSHVVQQLLHLGVGHLVAVDPDRIEPSNLSRVVGARSSDARDGAAKIAIVRRLADELRVSTRLTLIEGDVREPAAVAELLEADFVFGCTDTQLSRLLLNALAHQYYLPMLDLGVELQLGGSMGGRVSAIGPDGGCLWCWGILSPDGLRVEQLPAELRAEYVGRGYVTDMNVEQPAVVSINGVIASLGVTEMLRRVTGLAGDHEPAAMLLYRLADGTVRRVGRLSSGCVACAGHTTGLGELTALPGVASPNAA